MEELVDSSDRIAVVVAFHNRKVKTVAALKSLIACGIDFDLYCTDDGSSDGTVSAVVKLLPECVVYQGDGNLFWSRGMEKAWALARAKDYGFYLWLNDDVVLKPHALRELLDISRSRDDKAIVVGLVADAYTGNSLYGGVNLEGEAAAPTGKPQRLKRMNGNVVLVPGKVTCMLGGMDPVFHHDLGDVDYGLRAIRAGIEVLSTGTFVAEGFPNPIVRIRRDKVRLAQRMRALYSPLGSPPSINFYFRRTHYGLHNAVAYYLYLHLINAVGDSVFRFINHARQLMRRYT